MPINKKKKTREKYCKYMVALPFFDWLTTAPDLPFVRIAVRREDLVQSCHPADRCVDKRSSKRVGCARGKTQLDLAERRTADRYFRVAVPWNGHSGQMSLGRGKTNPQ